MADQAFIKSARNVHDEFEASTIQVGSGGHTGEVIIPADLYFTVLGLLNVLINREVASGNDPS